MRVVALAVLLSSAVLGCSGQRLAPVEGTVVWEDGMPAKELEGSLVIFESLQGHHGARGNIQPDGSFVLSSLKVGDGALVGEHRVAIVERRRDAGGGVLGEGDLDLGKGGLLPRVLDVKFSEPAKSDLRATVVPGKNLLQLKVRRTKSQ